MSRRRRKSHGGDPLDSSPIDSPGATSPYAPVTATSPTLLVPLKYASTDADGQILYEDDVATDTVEASGDPAGGVQWDGSSVAVQATDADRPVWQGETRGTNFDRSSGQHLYSPEPATFWKFLNHTGGTIVASVKPDDLTNPKRILTTRESGNGIYFDINNNDLRFGSEAGGSPANRAASGVISAGVYQQVAAAFDPTTMKFYVDGVLVRDTSQTNFGDVDPEDTAHFGSEIGTGGNYFDGDIEYIAVYDRVLTQSEIQSIEVK